MIHQGKVITNYQFGKYIYRFYERMARSGSNKNCVFYKREYNNLTDEFQIFQQ